MRLLVKYPTRGRPKAFLERLAEYAGGAARPLEVAFLVSYDEDDTTMTEDTIASALELHPHVKAVRGASKTKIQACNADVEKSPTPWDILLLISDDMFLRFHGYDDLIRRDMSQRYPDTDGCLWYHDNSRQRRISTLACMGRKYYERFGYIYHPSYKAFFCDNEMTEVARRRSKIHFSPTVIASHEHPAWCGAMPHDETYARSWVHWNADKSNYRRRRSSGFRESPVEVFTKCRNETR